MGVCVGQVRAANSKRIGVKTPPMVFDRGHLVRYTMESPELEREIVGLFVAQLPSILDRLFTAQSSEDWRFATHTLKGSAQAIGLIKSRKSPKSSSQSSVLSTRPNAKSFWPGWLWPRGSLMTWPRCFTPRPLAFQFAISYVAFDKTNNRH